MRIQPLIRSRTQQTRARVRKSTESKRILGSHCTLPMADALISGASFLHKSGYHIGRQDSGPSKGLVMIAGQAMSEPQNVVSAKYRCDGCTPFPQFDEGDPMDHVPYLPACPPGDLLEFRVVFPQCWDGVNLTSEDQRSHMSYPILAEAPTPEPGGVQTPTRWRF